jgi:hypothetical protein
MEADKYINMSISNVWKIIDVKVLHIEVGIVQAGLRGLKA